MAIVRAMVIIPRKTAVPADAVVNTFHFITDDAVTGADTAAIASRLNTFYGSVLTPGTDSIHGHLSGLLNTAGVRYKMYDLGQAEPRAPIYDEAQTWADTPDNTALPAEVAVCLSYQGLKLSGIPQARRRGRIYIGPLGNTALTFVSGAAASCRPSASVMNALAGAGASLSSANDAGLKWVVYSPTNNSAVDVTDGWVDNAFDTQRRRGEGASARTLWT